MGNNKNKRGIWVKRGGAIERENDVELQWHCWAQIKEAQEIAR
jgi:hypothetical protein